MRRLLYNNPVVVEYVHSLTGLGRAGPGAIGFGTFDTERGIIGGAAFDWATDTNIFIHTASTNMRWITPSLLWAVFYYPFNQLGVDRLTGMTAAKNHKALAFQDKLGFQRECLMRGAAPGGDDLILNVLWKDDCKYIDNPRYQLQERHVDFEFIGVPHG